MTLPIVARLKRTSSVTALRQRLGVPPRPHDRYLLEDVIFPALRREPNMVRILFAGCADYTASYADRFRDRTFLTIDIDPRKARFGAPRHIVGDLAEVADHFSPGTLDAVICNGVIGWGLDDPKRIDRAANQVFECLRAGGILIVGWNDMEPWRPVPLEGLAGFQRFTPFALAPFPCPVYHTLSPLRHVFNCYVRES